MKEGYYMGYIQEIRKYVGHSPIMVTAAMCIIYDKEKGILLEKRTDNIMPTQIEYIEKFVNVLK